MATLSRTEKYKNLREKIQDENGSDLSAPDLSAYESRLNRIDSNNFAAPGTSVPAPRSGNAAHARKEPASSTIRRNQERSKKRREVVDGTRISSNENYTDDAFDNDYLNRYIQEVKQYNIEQGNAVSENTTVNVLAQLDADRSEVRRAKQKQAEEKPAAEIETDDFDDTGDGLTFGDSGLDILGSSKKKSQPSQDYTAPQETPLKKKPLSRLTRRKNRMAEAIDSLADTEALTGKYEQKPTVNAVKREEKPVEEKHGDFTDNLDFDDDFVDEKPQEEPKSDEPSGPLSKEDIMAQVQSMVNESRTQEEEKPAEDPDHVDVPVGQDTYNRHLAEDNAKHQAVLNETNSMRAQLDDYEDDLSEVSDKVRHTNQILNIVLIVLIIALSIVLCVVIYWIIRGM